MEIKCGSQGDQLLLLFLLVSSERMQAMTDSLGRVLDKSTRVQVLDKLTSKNKSTGFSKVFEYKYKNLKRASTNILYFVPCWSNVGPVSTGNVGPILYKYYANIN